MRKKFLLLGLLACVLLLFSACGRRAEVTVTGFTIDTSYISEPIIVDEFDYTEIELIVTKSDDSTERINLTSSMMSSAHRNLLTTVGVHTITVNYSGFSQTFTVELIARYTQLELQLMAIYDLGVASGLIVDDYEDWLESIRGADGQDGQDGQDGEDGVGIASLTINASGHLIVTLTNGNVVDAGQVVGEVGPEGPQGPTGPTGPVGPPGSDGQDGQDGQDGEDGIWVVDVYIDENYDVIVELSDGSFINAGNVSPQPKLSVYELYLLYNPWYEGDEMQWIHDLAYGNLEPLYNPLDPGYPDGALLIAEAYEYVHGPSITIAGRVVSYTVNYVLLERDGDYLLAYVGWGHPHRIGDALEVTGYVYPYDNYIYLDANNVNVLSTKHYVDIEHEMTTLEMVYMYDSHDFETYYGKPIILEGAIIQDGYTYLVDGEHRIHLDYYGQYRSGDITSYVGEYVRLELHYIGTTWMDYPLGIFDPDIHAIEIIEGDPSIFVTKDIQYITSRSYESYDEWIDLPMYLPHKSNVQWVSNNPEYVDDNGYIHTFPESSMYVSFTGTVSRGSYEETVVIQVYINLLELRTIGSLSETDNGRMVHVEGIIYFKRSGYVYIYDDTGYLRVPDVFFNDYNLGDMVYLKGEYSSYGGGSINYAYEHNTIIGDYDMPVFSTEPYTLAELFTDEDVKVGMIVHIQGYVQYVDSWYLELIVGPSNYQYMMDIYLYGSDLSAYVGQIIEIEVLLAYPATYGWTYAIYNGGFVNPIDMDEYYFDSDINYVLAQDFIAFEQGSQVYFIDEGPHGTTFTYESLNPTYLDDDGFVVFMPEETLVVEVMVTATRGMLEDSFVIYVTLKVLEPMAIGELTDDDINNLVMVEGVVYDYLEGIVMFISDETGEMMILLFDYPGLLMFEVGDVLRITGYLYKQFDLYVIEAIADVSVGDGEYAYPEPKGHYTLDQVLSEALTGGSVLTVEGYIDYHDGNIRIMNSEQTVMGFIFTSENYEDYLLSYIGLYVEVDVILFGIEDYEIMFPIFIFTSTGEVRLEGEASQIMYDVHQLQTTPIYSIGADVELPETGYYGTEFTYTSLNPSIISDAGVIVEMPSETTAVTFHVTATLGEETRMFEMTVTIYVEDPWALGDIITSVYGPVEGIVYGTLSDYYALIYDETGYAVIYHDGTLNVSVGDTLFHIGYIEYREDEILWIEEGVLFKTSTEYAMPLHVGEYDIEAFILTSYAYGTPFTLTGEYLLVHLESQPTEGIYIHVFMDIDLEIMFMIVYDALLTGVEVGEPYTLDVEAVFIFDGEGYGFVVLEENPPIT